MVNVSFNQTELEVLQALIDAGVRATGLQSAKSAVLIITKLEKAVANYNAEQAKSKENTESEDQV
jgi:hypothetical protein